VETEVLVCPECDDFFTQVVMPKGFTATLVRASHDDGTADYHNEYGDHQVTVQEA